LKPSISDASSTPPKLWLESAFPPGAASRRKEKPMAHISQPNSLASQSDISSIDMGKGLQSPLTFWLMLCGGVGAVLFTATYLLEGATRPGYDAWQQPISALSLGTGGWVQQVNFVVFGVLLLLSVAGWYRFLAPEKAAPWFSLLQGISGLGLMGAGVFSMDPFPGYPPGTTPSTSTVQGTLHTICAFTVILALALGCFALAAHFWRIAHWRGWAVYSWITGILMLVLWGAFVHYPTSPVAGLVERLSAGSHDLWMCALLVMLFFPHRRQRISR